MQAESTPKLSFTASCFCGAASWRFEGEPTLQVYCHCTRCQRRTGAPFIHALHFPITSLSWTHENPNAVFSVQVGPSGNQWSIYRCQSCYTTIGANNPVLGFWTVKAEHLERDPTTFQIKNFDKIKPTAHIFYGTRLLDVPDGLPKWDGHENESNRLELP